MRYSKKKRGNGVRANSKKKRRLYRAEQTRKRKAVKKEQREKKELKILEKKASKLIRQHDNKNLSHVRRYEATKELSQYSNIKDRLENVKVFLKDEAKLKSSSRLKWIATMTAKNWTKEKAEGLYDLVTTDVYNQFRQKYKPPSDYYDILLADFMPEDIEKAMLELNKSNDYEQGNYKSSEVINALYDILVNTL